MNKEDKTFGWNFPIKVDKKTGKILTTDLKTDVRQSIMILLNTMKRERLFHSNYGCDLNRFMFEPVSYNLVKEIKDEVISSIMRWEQRISNITVKVLNNVDDENILIISIQYFITEMGAFDSINYAYNLLDEI